ncbi:MAG: adenylyltransferase [Candidatus Binatia bacterium]|nr:MAG: adenylyltransferase [Candidatus Binatia bacterium]
MNDSRYERQIRLPEIGPSGQRKLREARVLVVGVGGLGCPVALLLAGAGVGKLGLVDPDRVELSNLHRQTLYRTSHVGRAKVECAAEEIRARNPEVALELFPRVLEPGEIEALARRFDFVVDGTDSVTAKFALHDAVLAAGTPLSYAGVVGWLGQTTTLLPGRGPCLRCLFPVPPADDLPECQYAGVVGSVVGAVAAVQANEVLKALLGVGRLLHGRLLVFDGLALRWREVPLVSDPRCPRCRAGLEVESRNTTLPREKEPSEWVT